MYRLTYISTAREPITGPMLESILAASRRNNRAFGVTGLLIAGRNRFLQALEGEQAVVESLYQAICGDPRHFACVRLREERPEDRQFAEWAMGAVGAGGDPCPQQLAAARGLVASIDDVVLRAEFASFLELHDRAA